MTLVNITKLAKELGTSRVIVNRLEAEGVIRSLRLGSRRYFVLEEAKNAVILMIAERHG